MSPTDADDQLTGTGSDTGTGAANQVARGGLIERVSRWIETALLTAILLAMIGLASAQVLLRGSVGGSLAWADETLRLLVLWAAMIGAVAASRDNVHLRIDFLSRFLSPGNRRVAAVVVNLFAAGISAILAWQSLRFVNGSREFDDQVLGDWPAWPFQVVLPIAFMLIAYRYIHDIWRQFHGGTPSSGDHEA
ncbi:MAG: TRAP transporter small permease [Gammaproteobacteria bacterium]